jgi:putative redox protein
MPANINSANFFTVMIYSNQRKFRQKYIMTSTVTYEGNLRTVCVHLRSGSAIETDAPVDNNGRGERFSPSDLVATALGTCMLTIMGMRAVEMDVDLKGTKIEVEKIMKSDPRRIGRINLTFHFPETLEISDRQQTILQRAAETCPVAYSINPEIELSVNFNWSKVKVTS